MMKTRVTSVAAPAMHAGVAHGAACAPFDMDEFMPITFQEHRSVLREFGAATGISHTCN
ncbi:hypothetical protein NHN26_05550 [Rhodovulum tesquicola]|uniref:hypothetical protein n=1 Tax=Rhodovulum tesquicola TaxID=540254 RepID=UPI002098560A|nr:hypothetical protein [Rhodovulum tesquicola]MCO8144686.1 hypothetical protein [Rhodovulum tesquicola]